MNGLQIGIAAHTETDERLKVYVATYRDRTFLRAISLQWTTEFVEMPLNLHIDTDRAFKRGVYRHYSGGFYQGLGVASYNATAELLAIYVALTGAHLPGPRLRGRPLELFLGSVRVGDDAANHHMVPRFTHIGDEIPARELPIQERTR